MSVRIQLRRDTAANWASSNPTLTQGEPGYETDTGKIKYGDGSTAWNSLDYAVAAAVLDGIVSTAKLGGDITIAGKALLDDADAAAQRTTLGLGTLATQNGTFSGTSSGTNTGDQTITLTGDVTGSGTGSFAATVANGAITDAKVASNAAISGSKLQAASTSNAGAVQLTDSTSSTSTSTAATPNAVKSAFDLANAAIPKSLVDAKGDLLVATANDTVARLAVGSNNQVLTADSTQASGLKWATAGGGGSWTLISSVTASNSASVAFTSGLNSTYDIYQITFVNLTGTVDGDNLACRFSSDGGASYYSGGSSYNYTEINSNSTFNSTGTGGYIRLNSLTPISTGYGRTAGYILLYTPAVSYKMLFEHRGPDGRDGGWQRANIGRVDVATAINAVQFFGSSGNLEGGTFRLYGLKNS